jgi:hypothetical protein
MKAPDPRPLAFEALLVALESDLRV